jgi:PAS domain S-box-containing protein
VRPFEIESPPPRVREARLRSLLRLATTPMLIADRNRRVVDVNPMACELVGATREAVIGRRIDDFTATEVGFDVERFWTRFLEEGRVNGTYPAKRLDGELRPIVYAATANVVPGLHLSIFARGTNGPAPPQQLPLRREGPLTPREAEILQLIADGLTDREIAGRLVISPATARTHARNLIGKLGAHTRAQAVAIGIRRGEISL